MCLFYAINNYMFEDSDGYKQLGLLDGTYDLSVNGVVIGKINLSEEQNSYNQTDNPSYKLFSCDSVDGNYVINLTQTTAKITVIDRYGETDNPEEPDKPNDPEKPSVPKNDTDNEADDSNSNNDNSSNNKKIVNEEKQEKSNKQKNDKKNVNSSIVAPQTGDQGSFLIKLSMAVLVFGIIFVAIGLHGKKKENNQ